MRKLLLLVSVVFLSSACSYVKVVRQANPNPFVNKTHFNVAPIDFSHAVINDKSESAWAADGDSDEKKDWAKNKADATKNYLDMLLAGKGALTIETSGQPGGDAILVKPTVISIVPGFWVGFARQPTQVSLRLTLLTEKGEIADEVETNAVVDATMFTPSFNQRLGNATEALAKTTLRYLRDRSAAQK